MSQKSSTFALMIELERHIEVLLLSHDCVIVPDLGGFMTHHCEAHFDDEDNMFLPPLRTLGFNPQLKMNDSLLAQSYIEAYDISYPEAMRRIETEVAELKLHLSADGYYDLNDIGVLSVNDEGKLEFEPCEAGILTPAFYGLSSFEMPPLYGVNTHSHKKVEEADENTPEKEVEDHEAITIQMSWIRNTVAAAAAILAFFMMTPHIDNSEQPGVSMSQMSLPILIKDTAKKPDMSLDVQSIKEATDKHDTTSVDTPAPAATPAAPAKEEPATVVKETTKETTQPSTVYCIVVASQVSQHNAEAFVKKLQQEGMKDARVHVHHNIRRVVCGSYATEAEAYGQLQDLRNLHENLQDAWVYKIAN